LIRGGTVVTADARYEADVVVEGETIVRIERGWRADADLIVDAAGKVVLPGAVDPHTHLDSHYEDSPLATTFGREPSRLPAAAPPASSTSASSIGARS